MILESLGGPLGRPWAGFWEENLEALKKSEKNVVSVVASAGDAYPSKEGFGEDSQVGQVQHAFAHPNGWAGGLFALRVTRRGYLETRRLGGLVTQQCGNCKGDEVFACAVLLSFSSIRGALVA